MVRQMDMSYSYKPVLLKAVQLFADDKGRVPQKSWRPGRWVL